MDSNPEKPEDIFLTDALKEISVTLDILHSFREQTESASMTDILNLARRLEVLLSSSTHLVDESTDEVLFEFKTHVESLVLEKIYVLKKQAEMLGDLMFSLDKFNP